MSCRYCCQAPAGVDCCVRSGCDIVVADDGLQHYAMERDIEIAVVDASRGVGNGLLLPAGPLREPVDRLNEVDFVICNGGTAGLVAKEYVSTNRPVEFRRLSDDQIIPVTAFYEQYPWVPRPLRYRQSGAVLAQLTELGITVEPHIYPDHHGFTGDELSFADGRPSFVLRKTQSNLPLLISI